MTAVDVDLLAGDEIAVRHQEEYRFGDFLGASEATQCKMAVHPDLLFLQPLLSLLE